LLGRGAGWEESLLRPLSSSARHVVGAMSSIWRSTVGKLAVSP
jgi:hypothetical protein